MHFKQLLERRDARQHTLGPPLIRRCLVCAALLSARRRDVRTCSDACRNALSRILRRHRTGLAARTAP